MATKAELQVTSFDAQDIKNRLIEFLQSTEEFGDFNYEGSAINTLLDTLVRNDVYLAYMANQLGNESFIRSAQIRGNVVSHASKLSYTPRSATASTLTCDIDVIPDDTNDIPSTITLDVGTPFLTALGGQTYTFVTNEQYRLIYRASLGVYRATGVQLYQGQRITNKFIHNANESITIPNLQADTSTFLVRVADSGALSDLRTYTEATTIQELSSDSRVYFLSEDDKGYPFIEFGRNLIGNEPNDEAVVEITYINTEENHANGISSLVSGGVIGGYSNISVDVTSPSAGGSPREDIEDIRFLSPKIYQSQDRALSEYDYVPLLKQRFPFVKSAIAWGGERNDPPKYGNVLISILSDQTDIITTSIRTQIEDYFKDYNVGSVTPIIVEPSRFYLDLTISFSNDERLSGKSFSQLSTEINTVVDSYDEDKLSDFSRFFNESELVSRIKDIDGVVTVVIDKKAYSKINVLRFTDPIYNINFNNPIIKGSLSMTDFEISSVGTNHRLYDKDGVVYVEYNEPSGSLVTNNVGDINYDTGEVEFKLNMIQDANEVKLFCEPQDENFYVKRNSVVFIDDIQTKQINIQT